MKQKAWQASDTPCGTASSISCPRMSIVLANICSSLVRMSSCEQLGFQIGKKARMPSLLGVRPQDKVDGRPKDRKEAQERQNLAPATMSIVSIGTGHYVVEFGVCTGEQSRSHRAKPHQAVLCIITISNPYVAMQMCPLDVEKDAAATCMWCSHIRTHTKRFFRANRSEGYRGSSIQTVEVSRMIQICLAICITQCPSKSCPGSPGRPATV